MKKQLFKSFYVSAFLILLLCSCASNKKILYLQDPENLNSEVQSYANIIEADDNIVITVTSSEPELANDFNLMFLMIKGNAATNINNESMMGYLVDANGEIDFPILGKIKVAGLTRIQAEAKIKDMLRPHLANPGVNLRVLNFKVSVLGEVRTPGVQTIPGDRITILEAIGAAGDLTVYGKRNDILVIREQDGVRTINQVDITKTDFITSPYYYLAHNDVVYVQPNKTRVNSSVIGPNLTVGISAISLLITIITLSTR